MSADKLSFMLESGLDLREVVTTGSILQINQEFDEDDLKAEENNDDLAPQVDILGQAVSNFAAFSEKLETIKETEHVKKKIIVEGGGLPLHDGCTVFIAYSGYWENQQEPFDLVPLKKPMEVDLSDNGLLPGLQFAIKTMLVGETSVFLCSYKVMYGEMGVPPRIKPKADCVFYIKLIKSTLTPKQGKINFSESNMFQRVNHEVKMLTVSGTSLFKTNNYYGAIQLFKRAVNMLHRCRLADEQEEAVQEKLLKKLYINLVVCYNKVNKPLFACTACNELNRLGSLWNNPKVLFQNAKSLRMIKSYPEAQIRLKKAMKLQPGNKEMEAEYALLMKQWQDSDETKKHIELVQLPASITDEFKREVDDLIKNFKSNNEESKITIPSCFNSDEIAYFKEVCIRENLFFNKHLSTDNDSKPKENAEASEACSESSDYLCVTKDQEKVNIV
ncbi:inactive peptidyl-prolyl cis-trans isomerase shutdown-like [Spodoptera litura]|uniref:peptidylprolyl isomerase n=1 Tax=Spodoptera litura TaxID=69820 RepID=A0A9J7IQ77_SPOLT|nr:inactive peptidyl-prolyl cis-trans isomerase shutdown-like [Spodoptera litura]